MARGLVLTLLLMTAEAVAAPPNVIVISVDTLRSDRLPAYGYSKIRTPNIDGLRRDAVLFERAWTPAPLTAPAHASLLTGLLPAQHGIRDNGGYKLGAGVLTLAQRLQSIGYTTGAAVSSYVLRSEIGLGRGFAFYDDRLEGKERERPGDRTVAAANAWMSAQSGKPFFLFLHLYEPHRPYQPMKGIADPYDAEIVRADGIVGRFLDELRRRGIYENALIIFLSDHGEGLNEHLERDHGVLLYREAIQVPLIVKWPARRWAGSSVPTDVSLIDVAPTILGAAGVAPRTLPGSGLTSFVNAPRRTRAIYSETFYPRIHLDWNELRSIISGDYHLIAASRVELYDLARDPRERKNIAAEQRRTTAALRAMLQPLTDPYRRPSTPANAEALQSLGYLSGGGGQAATFFRPDPKDRLVILPQMILLMRAIVAGRNEDALKRADAILAKHPDFEEVIDRKAGLLVTLGREKEAKQLLLDAAARKRGPSR